jgi:hypothetical protein
MRGRVQELMLAAIAVFEWRECFERMNMEREASFWCLEG